MLMLCYVYAHEVLSLYHEYNLKQKPTVDKLFVCQQLVIIYWWPLINCTLGEHIGDFLFEECLYKGQVFLQLTLINPWMQVNRLRQVRQAWDNRL